MAQTVVPTLLFDREAAPAADFYVSVFPNSRVVRTARYPDDVPGLAGEVMSVEWELNGVLFRGFNGGPQPVRGNAVSFSIECADQAEVDHYWDKLSAGGSASGSGWLSDSFGISWQIMPTALTDALADPDPSRGKRAMDAFVRMTKPDVAAIEAAAAGG